MLFSGLTKCMSSLNILNKRNIIRFIYYFTISIFQNTLVLYNSEIWQYLSLPHLSDNWHSCSESWHCGVEFEHLPCNEGMLFFESHDSPDILLEEYLKCLKKVITICQLLLLETTFTKQNVLCTIIVNILFLGLLKERLPWFPHLVLGNSLGCHDYQAK